MKKLNSKSGCSVEVTLSVMGGTWKPIIIFKLMEGRRLRFMELSREIPSVTQRMLTLQLRELEADGIVERTVYAEVPPRVDYELTRLGRSLKPVLLAMREWGITYTTLLGRTHEDRPVKAEVGSELEMAGSSGT